MRDAGVKPEHECFDSGHINNVKILQDVGIGDPKPHFSLIMGVHGGIAATSENLVHQVSTLPPRLALAGHRRAPAGSVAHGRRGTSLGGSVRVGLEDNFYTSEGVMATSNGELVEKAARMTREVGRIIAEPNEARRMLGLSVPERASSSSQPLEAQV